MEAESEQHLDQQLFKEHTLEEAINLAPLSPWLRKLICLMNNIQKLLDNLDEQVLTIPLLNQLIPVGGTTTALRCPIFSPIPSSLVSLMT
jgi:hypothetical protein